MVASTSGRGWCTDSTTVTPPPVSCARMPTTVAALVLSSPAAGGAAASVPSRLQNLERCFRRGRGRRQRHAALTACLRSEHSSFEVFCRHALQFTGTNTARQPHPVCSA